MSLEQFVQKWLGKRTDYDHVYQYQCVDLILQYVADCYGITSGVWGNAIDYWTNPTPRLLQYFDKVKGPQQAGDIVILNGLPGNPYGHIMVAVDGTRCIEQNGQTGDGSGTGGNAVRYRITPTARVAGILRPKKKGNTMYPNKGDLVNIYNATGWKGHPPNANDFAYWTNGTSNPTWAKGADAVWKELAYSVSDWVLHNPKTVTVHDGGIDPATKAEIDNTNSVVQWIKDKLSNIFK